MSALKRNQTQDQSSKMMYCKPEGIDQQRPRTSAPHFFHRLRSGLAATKRHLDQRPQNRRHFLKTIATVASLGLLSTLFPQKSAARKEYLLSRPRKLKPSRNSRLRFRHKAKHGHSAPRFRVRGYQQTQSFPANLRDTFQMNRSTKVIHYIDRHGWSSERAGLQPANLEPLSRQEVISSLINMDNSGPAGPRIHLSQLGPVAERLALEQARGENIDLAIELLRSVIRYDTDHRASANYRLYDLLAGLACRSWSNRTGPPQPIEELVEYIQRYWINNKTLTEKCKRWLEPNSGWLTKWRSKELLWKFPER